MVKLILLIFLLSFARDPFLDFREIKSNTKNIRSKFVKIKYLGLVQHEPVLKVNTTLVFPLENKTFKNLIFNETCISFRYKSRKYKICR